jgi:hypothetical protein
LLVKTNDTSIGLKRRIGSGPAGSLQAGPAESDISRERRASRVARRVRPARIAWKAGFDADVCVAEKVRWSRSDF